MHIQHKQFQSFHHHLHHNIDYMASDNTDFRYFAYTWTVGMTDLLRWALILLFTLPGPYVLPVFARGEADARYASSCLSLYTLLSVAMFCVIAVLAV